MMTVVIGLAVYEADTSDSYPNLYFHVLSSILRRIDTYDDVMVNSGLADKFNRIYSSHR